jgi:hypothetical protein
MKTRLLSLAAALAVPFALHAAKAPLSQATFTKVINDVKVVAPETKAIRAATLQSTCLAPEVIRTAADSLAELTAPDKTITRVGANTVFSFAANGRTVNLEQGSLLFHSPKGKGGGTIKTGGAAATVLGTTLMVSSTANGGFKVIVIEGKANVTLADGKFRTLTAGQELFVLPGMRFGPTVTIRLDTLVKGSRLVNGFGEPLASDASIRSAIQLQEEAVAGGRAEETGLFVIDDGVGYVDESPIPTDPGITQVRFNETALQRAMTTDILIQSALIAQNHPQNFFPGPEMISSGNYSLSDFSGLVGKNVTVDHPGVLLDPNNGSRFDIVAAGTLTLNNITGPSSGQIDFHNIAASPIGLLLVGVEGVNIAPLHSIGGINLDDMTIFSGGSMNISQVGFFPGASAQMTLEAAGGNLFLNNVSVQSDFLDLIASSDINASTLSLDVSTFFYGEAGNNISINSPTFLTSPSGVDLKAGNQLSLFNANFTGVNSVSLDARTVILNTVDFSVLPPGQFHVIKSQTGLLAANPNTGALPVPGFVNFINNVTVGGTPANFLNLNVADTANANATATIQIQVR